MLAWVCHAIVAISCYSMDLVEGNWYRWMCSPRLLWAVLIEAWLASYSWWACPTRLETRTKESNMYASFTMWWKSVVYNESGMKVKEQPPSSLWGEVGCSVMWAYPLCKSELNIGRSLWQLRGGAWCTLGCVGLRSRGRQDSSVSVPVGTRKMVNYAWIGWSQRKLWWKLVAVLTCKSIVKFGYRGERLIEPSSSWFPPKFPSG